MRIHWFSFTVHAGIEVGRSLWKRHFFHSLGDLVETERKGRGFEKIDVALCEAKLYYQPVQPKKKGIDGQPLKVEYFHIELTGTACDALVPTIFQDVVNELKSSGLRWNVTRLDLAFDELPFTPVDFCRAIMNGHAVTCAKRESLSIVQSPFALREDGQMGCDTCYLGAKDSQRMIRVYNSRGFTRLEMVCKDERALAVALDLFENEYRDWDFVAREHVVQYIRFKEWAFPDWDAWIGVAQSADIKVSSARVMSFSGMQEWHIKSTVVSLSVLEDVLGKKEFRKRFDEWLHSARSTRDRSRYKAVLQLAG